MHAHEEGNKRVRAPGERPRVRAPWTLPPARPRAPPACGTLPGAWRAPVAPACARPPPVRSPPRWPPPSPRAPAPSPAAAVPPSQPRPGAGFGALPRRRSSPEPHCTAGPAGPLPREPAPSAGPAPPVDAGPVRRAPSFGARGPWQPRLPARPRWLFMWVCVFWGEKGERVGRWSESGRGSVLEAALGPAREGGTADCRTVTVCSPRTRGTSGCMAMTTWTHDPSNATNSHF